MWSGVAVGESADGQKWFACDRGGRIPSACDWLLSSAAQNNQNQIGPVKRGGQGI